MVAEDCIANDPCCPPTVCNGPMRYIQPEIPKSFKPPAVYRRSNVPLDSETVYKTSYFSMHPCDSPCRTAPIVPMCNLRVDHAIKMDGDTVTALSYPGHHAVCRQRPIYPCSHRLLGTGPMQDLTTQKHDYVAKPIIRRPLLRPKGLMQLTPLPLDSETIQKLSYPSPCNFTPTKSCKPITCYQRPCVPMDVETTHNCSYMPVCPPVKEIFPWARKPCYQMPCVPIANETTYKLSYLGGTGCRQPLQTPCNTPCMLSCNAGFDDRTVYKESFLTTSGSCRPNAIRPVSNLCCMPGVPMDGDTMYGLAYAGHYCVPKQKPIMPCRRSLLGTGPMQDLTTQKHDFVCKPICRRAPFLPRNMMHRTTVPLEKTTTANASYMPITQVARTVSCKPRVCWQRPRVPMDVDTTQKLSFQPVCPPPKECHEWAQKARYRMPQVPMDTETVQKLSYGAPGRFVSGDNNVCCVPPICEQFPRAAVC